jgi:L-lysine exporter family protein LysE/ArgO
MPADLALTALLQGVVLGAGLCFTLGPQSVFVLRQGLRREAAATVAAICSGCDLLLVALAATCFGLVEQMLPGSERIVAWVGAAFVMAYGAQLIWDAGSTAPIAVCVGPAARRVIVTALALSLLNPQVWFEMVAIVGSVAAGYPAQERCAFALGVVLASPAWFYGLALAGRRFTLFLAHARTARWFDLANGAVMLLLGLWLLSTAPD